MVISTLILIFNFSIGSLVVFLGVIVMLYLSYFPVYKAKTVEFDYEYMYITDSLVNEMVPLGNIYKIQLTMIGSNYNNFWKIGYSNQTNATNFVRLLPVELTGDWERFKKLVRHKNPLVEIKNWATSWETDF